LSVELTKTPFFRLSFWRFFPLGGKRRNNFHNFDIVL